MKVWFKSQDLDSKTIFFEVCRIYCKMKPSTWVSTHTFQRNSHHFPTYSHHFPTEKPEWLTESVIPSLCSSFQSVTKHFPLTLKSLIFSTKLAYFKAMTRVLTISRAKAFVYLPEMQKGRLVRCSQPPQGPTSADANKAVSALHHSGGFGTWGCCMTCKHNISLDTETSAEHQVPTHYTSKHTTLESVLKFQNCLYLPLGPRQ